MQRSYSWFFFLCAAEGVLALSALLLIPSEGGLSLARLGLFAILALLAGMWTFLGLRPPRGLDSLARPAWIVLAALLSLVLGWSLFFLRYLDPERLLPIYERLSPLLWYLLILSLQAVFFLLTLKSGFRLEASKERRSTLLASLTFFALLLVLFLLVSLTKLGVTPDKAYWGEPGVAILGWQFALALLGGILVLCLSLSWRTSLLDLILPISIYLLAVTLWLSVPLDVLTNGFYVTIDPPSFQPFPYSDAGYYDSSAHSLLLGYSYQGDIPARPLYITFLFLLHKLFGENYPNIIAGQTLLLALIPVLLYLLARKIHSRAAGVTVALLFIFRELTSLYITSNTRVSNSKSLLTDLPTLLLLLASCYFTFRWLERRNQRNALMAGGMFGLLLFLRTQSLLVLPFVLLAAWIVLGWRNRSFYEFALLFALGTVAVLAPWLTRNYIVTGQLTFESPAQYKVIASQYAYTGNLDINNFDLEGKGVGQILLEFALKDPKFVFGFIANHFLAVEIDGLLALPLIKPYNGILAPVDLYWVTWNGSLEWYNTLLILFYILVISLGLGAAWKRWRWLGLLPLAYNVGYALATGVARFSGWRYDLPADWAPYFYFGIGFAEFGFLAASWFGSKEEGSAPNNASRRFLIPVPALFVLFAFIGALPWMAEKAASPRYADQTSAALIERVASMPGAPAPADLRAFAAQPGSFLEIGRALYPRYFSRGRGISSANPWPAYAPRDYPRLGFTLLNRNTTQAIFPTKGIPDSFPHGADVIVLACQRGDYVEARLVAFPALNILLTSAPLDEPCTP